MKGYLVKYSTGSYYDYYTHNIRVYLDLNQAGRYIEKFNKVISKAKDFYSDGHKEYYSTSLEDYNTKPEYWNNVYDKFEFYSNISEPWI